MMNDPLRDNTERLLQCRPDAPSPEFAARMDRLLRPSDPRRGLLRFLRIATAAAAALCVALLMGISGGRRASAPGRPAARTPEPRRETAAFVQDAVVGSLAAKDDAGRAVGELGLKEHRVSVEILDGIAKTTVEENFENHTDLRLEGTFRFPLPSDASISRLALEVNGKIEEGTCLERERARAVFESIVSRMKDPALLEWQPGGFFTCRIFPIEPRATKRVIVAYTQALPYFRGKMTYVYPLASEKTRTHPPEELQIDVRARFSGALAKIESPSHHLDVRRKDAHEASMTFRATRYRPNNDFAVTLEPADEEIRVVSHKVDGEDGYFACFVTPRGGGERQPGRHTFVLDASASVSAPRLDVARRLVRAMMEHRIEGDRFEILVHNVAVERSGEVDLRAANDFMDRIRPIGGSNVLEALRAAPADGEIIYIGKGSPTFGETDPSKILEAVKGRRIRTIAVGSDANLGLLEKLGGLMQVSPNEDTAKRVLEISATLGSPVVSGIMIEGGEAIYDLVGRRDIFHGERLLVAGRYRAPTATLVVSGSGYRREVAVAFPAKEEGNNYVRRLWAQRKVSDLLSQGPAAQADVTALGVKHQIMTPYTSFLVLENEQMWKDHQLRREVQKQDQVLGMESSGAEAGVAKHLRDAERYAMAGMHDQAVREYENALFKIENGPADAKPMKELLPSLNASLAKTRNARILGERRTEDEKKRMAEAESSAHDLQTKRDVMRTMAHLLELSYMAFDQKKYDRCIRLCDELLLIDPHYSVAKELKEDSEKTRHKEEYYSTLAAKVRHWKRLTDDDERAVIPWSQTVRFPSRDEWAEISKRLTPSVIRTEGSPGFSSQETARLSEQEKLRLDFVGEERAREDYKRAVDLRRERELLFGQAQMYFEQEQFARSMEVCEKLLRLDPNLSSAAEMRTTAQRFQHMKRGADLDVRSLARGWRETFDLYEADQETQDNELQFPDMQTWKELVAKRSAKRTTAPGLPITDALPILEDLPLVNFLFSESGVATEEGDPDLRAIRRKLDTMKIDLAFQNTKLEDVLAYLRDFSGLNILLDAEVRDKVDPDKPVTIKSVDLPLKENLRRVIAPFGLDYTITEENVVLLTDPWKALISKRQPKGLSDLREETNDEDESILDKLHSIRITINMQNAPLTAIVDYIREISGLNIHISGIDNPDCEMISFKVQDAVLDQALRLLLQPRAKTYLVRDGVVLICPAIRVRSVSEDGSVVNLRGPTLRPWQTLAVTRDSGFVAVVQALDRVDGGRARARALFSVARIQEGDRVQEIRNVRSYLDRLPPGVRLEIASRADQEAIRAKMRLKE